MIQHPKVRRLLLERRKFLLASGLTGLLAQLFYVNPALALTGTRGTPLSFNSLGVPANAITANSPIYYLSEWVVGDGSTDDTAALNAAFALAAGVSTGATFILNGVCKITDTVTIGDNTGSSSAPTSFINLICTGSNGAAPFRYAGPTDGRPAILFAKVKQSYVRGLGLQNNGSVGSSLGLQLGGTGGSVDAGTTTLAMIFDKCSVSGFDVGISDGNFGDSSEILWNSLNIYNCATGWTATGFNTLDHVFIMLQMEGCGVGLDSGASEGYHVYGGSSSAATICDFNVQSNGICDVTSFRNENSVGFVRGQGGSMSLKSCNVKVAVLSGNLTTAVPGGISISGSFDRLVFDSCGLNGWIAPASANNIEVTNSVLQIDPNNNLPLILPSTAYGTLAHLFCKNNEAQVSGVLANDFDGFITGGTSGTNTLINPVTLKVQQPGAPTANSGQTYGADFNALSHIRHLAEGPLPGVATATTQTATTSASSAAGTNVLTFTAVPSWLTPGMQVADPTTSGAIPFNTTVLYFSSTAVFLSKNITGAGVGSGDTINFTTYYGPPSTGKNLRVTGVFASSGTLNFTFTRNVTVNTGGSQSNQLVATTGIFYPSDVGKAISIANEGNQGWTNWYGYGVKYIDFTHLLVQPAGGQQNTDIPTTGGGVTAVVGQNEPDANYIVAGIVGNPATPEQYSVTAQSSSGFTVVSSNASSTATVNFMLVRCTVSRFYFLLSSAVSAAPFPVTDEDQNNIASICPIAARSPVIDIQLTANIASWCANWDKRMNLPRRQRRISQKPHPRHPLRSRTYRRNETPIRHRPVWPLLPRASRRAVCAGRCDSSERLCLLSDERQMGRVSRHHADTHFKFRNSAGAVVLRCAVSTSSTQNPLPIGMP